MSLIALCGAVVASGCLFPTEQEPDTGRRAAEFQTVASVQEATLLPLADTYLRQGSPNQSQGADPILRLQASGNNRALLRFDRAAIAAAVGAGPLQGARLELTIAVNADNWGTAGRTIDLHRLTQAWTEAGATWNCADDANPANQSADCEGETAWEMGGSGPHPWESVPAATATITNGLAGVVSLDVTAELAVVLASGGEHHGWILKKTLEGQAGRVEFGSRESGIPPRLVLSMAVGDTSRPATPTSFNLPDDSTRTVAAPWGTRERFYTDIVGVMFDDSTSGVRIQEILAKYHGVIIGGTAALPATVFFVQVPGPGGTYDAIERIATEIGRESGVLLTRIPTWRGRLRLKARYPDDGPQAKRADWFSATATDATRGLLAIRAPLAWGCENGLYGNTVKVGLIDRQAGAHVDLPGLAIREPFSPVEFSTPVTALDLEHALGVAGILAARGDNATGIAGVMWNLDLTMYNMGKSGGLSTDPVFDLFRHFSHLSDTLGTRLLSMSADVGTSAEEAAVRGFVLALDLHLRRGGILVYAVGNDGRMPTITELRGTTDTVFSALDKAVALLRDSLSWRNNIITVGATGVDGRFLQGTNFWKGGTDILAPGERILTLGASNQTSLALSGSSFSAPFVTGVAAQLWSMDPTLTAAQVRDYILRGARVPRLDPATGDSVPAKPVAGAPETIYQLDAYGALSLLSAERPGTPVCGFPVSTRGSDLVLERPAGEERFPVAGPHGAFAPSIAQGGRVIALSDGDGGVKVVDQRGMTRQTLAPPVFVRRYLERDTVDVLGSVDPDLGFQVRFRYRPSRPGVAAEYNPFALVSSLPQADPFFFAFSPTGDSLAIGTDFAPSPGDDTRRVQWDLVSVGSGTVMPIREWLVVADGQSCTGNCESFLDASARWSHSGQELVILLPGFETPPAGPPGEPLFRQFREFSDFGDDFGDILRHWTRVTHLRAGGAQAEETVDGWRLLLPQFTPDDSVLILRELTVDGTCQKVYRRAGEPNLWRKAVTVSAQECDRTDGFFDTPNLRAEEAMGPGVTPGAGSGAAGDAVRRFRARRPTRDQAN